MCNTVTWDIHCGAGYAVIYRFEHTDLASQGSVKNVRDAPIPQAHSTPRSPGANDAMFLMQSSSRYLQNSLLPHTGLWSINDIILTSGQATADNIAPEIAELQYMIRVPNVCDAKKVVQYLDHNAELAARQSNCVYKKFWVSKSRPGLPNHSISNAVFSVLKQVGAPAWGKAEKKIANEIRTNLGLEESEEPFLRESEKIISPLAADREIKKMLPFDQKYYTSDDYTEMCWHVPTARFYIGRPTLKPSMGFHYPSWVMNALGGIPKTIDPMIFTAAKTVGLSLIKFLEEPQILKKAKSEFLIRTGGGLGGKKWLGPLCDYEPPIDFAWPNYVKTEKGRDWPLSKKGYK